MNFNQFIPLSQLLTNFADVKKLIDEFGEVIVVLDDRPQYRITLINDTEDVVPKSLPNTPSRKIREGETTMDLLNKIGKGFFVEHYYDIKNNQTAADDLPENYTTNSKRSRISTARRIFREELHLEALKIVMSSNRLDQETIDKAKEIFEKETK